MPLLPVSVLKALYCLVAGSVSLLELYAMHEGAAYTVQGRRGAAFSVDCNMLHASVSQTKHSFLEVIILSAVLRKHAALWFACKH